MGQIKSVGRSLWRWINNFSTAQWLVLVGSSSVMGALTWIAHQPLWLVVWVSFGAFAVLVILAPRLSELWWNLFGARLVADRLHKATNTPADGSTAVRLIVRNKGGEKIEGLVAQIVGSDPGVAGFPEEFHLPFTLATKTRLDALRSNGEALPHLPFSLNAGTEKHVELFWLNSNGAIEGYITHEAGTAPFLVLDGYVFQIEISGESKPTRCEVRLFITDEETGAWDCEIVK